MHRHPLTGDQECPRPQPSDEQHLAWTPEKVKWDKSRHSLLRNGIKHKKQIDGLMRTLLYKGGKCSKYWKQHLTVLATISYYACIRTFAQLGHSTTNRQKKEKTNHEITPHSSDFDKIGVKGSWRRKIMLTHFQHCPSNAQCNNSGSKLARTHGSETRDTDKFVVSNETLDTTYHF